MLTLVVVASALYRMHVYQEAYGFTRLRLLVDVFEGWLGLLVLGVMAAGVALRAAWLPRAALLSGAGAAARRWPRSTRTPGSREHNLDRYDETGKVDWTYLQGLSDDAVPVLADAARTSVVGCALRRPRAAATTTGWSGTSGGTAPRTCWPATSPRPPGRRRTPSAGTNPASGPGPPARRSRPGRRPR